MQLGYTEFPRKWDKAADGPIQRDQRNGDNLLNLKVITDNDDQLFLVMNNSIQKHQRIT